MKEERIPGGKDVQEAGKLYDNSEPEKQSNIVKRKIHDVCSVKYG